MRRRAFVAAGLALGSAVAGCGGDPEPAETPADGATTAEPEPTERPTDAATATPDRTVTVAADPVIEVTEDAFVPRRLRVAPGTEVTWHNVGTATHSVEDELFSPGTASEWSFYSLDLLKNVKASHTFEDPGAYEYDCGVHGAETMCGVVLVGDVSYPATLPCEE